MEDYIYFGSYPQSEVTDETLKAELIKLGGNKKSWNTDEKDYSYKDVESNGKKYRGLFVLETKETHWFIYEPIKWKILSTTNEGAFLLSDMLIDTKPFEEDGNDYDCSIIREWLNNTFYNIAFSSEEKSKIETTTVKNSWLATGGDTEKDCADCDDSDDCDECDDSDECDDWPFCIDADDDTFSDDYYDCDDTEDKIFLPCFNDVTNESYGFKDDKDRIKNVTPYTKAKGAGSNWWLRTPCFNANARIVVNSGFIDYAYDYNWDQYSVYIYRLSVAPALYLKW